MNEVQKTSHISRPAYGTESNLFTILNEFCTDLLEFSKDGGGGETPPHPIMCAPV